MLKPAYTKFRTSHEMHSAMHAYACSLNKPTLNVSVEYGDGSIFEHSFEPAVKEVTYRVPDKEEGYYTQTVDVGRKWKADFLVPYNLYESEEFSRPQIKSLFEDWLPSPKSRKKSDQIKKITWSINKD